MQIGTYADGQPLNYDELTYVFDVGGNVVEMDHLHKLSDIGKVTWASEEIRSWFFATFCPPTPEEARATNLALAKDQRDEDLATAMTCLREGRITPSAEGVGASLILKAGEKVFFSFPGITLREPRAVSRGVYGGPSIRVAKGLTIRVGGFQAQSHEELKDIDTGTLVLTTKRLVFSGNKRSVENMLAKLISVDAYDDAVAVRRTGKERTEVYVGLDRSTYEFAIEGRNYKEPFSGLILKYMIEGLVGAG